jgi:hypothetical protein
MNDDEKSYYVILHVYHHFLVVGELLSPSRIRCSRVVRVNSCKRGWTDFFRNGCKDDTTMMEFPPGNLNDFMGIFNWDHPIPEVK